MTRNASLLPARGASIAMLGLFLVSPLSEASEDAYLSGAEIARMLAGHSVQGEEDGITWKELFAPGGTIEGDWGGSEYQGDWRVDGNLLCLDYTGTTDDGCWRLANGQGSIILWYSKDGTPDARRRGVQLKD